MTYAKLTIRYEEGREGNFSEEFIEASFNPTQLAYSRSVTWSPSYTAGHAKSSSGFGLQYHSTAPETLTVELFFDTYAATSDAGGGLFGLLSSSGSAAQSVLPFTDAVAALASIDQEMHRPPVCRLSWGEVNLFQGVLQQTSRTLLLFLEDGTPVRATMGCTFMEYPGDTGAAGETHSPDVAKKYTVRPGDTLMDIAISLYGDAALWRTIAEANRIDNPRRLVPGQTLSIPRLR